MKRKSTRLRQGVLRMGPVLMVLLFLCWGYKAAANPLQPVITSMSAISGRPSTSLTLTGTGFNDTASRNVVFFGGAQATVTAASLTSLTVTIPVGAVYGPVSVLNLTTGLMAYTTQYFTPTFNPAPYIPFSRAFKTRIDEQIVGTVHTNSITYHAVTGDIDGDGKMDLIVASYDSFIFARSPIEIFRNIGSAGTMAFAAPVICTASYGARNIHLGDIDGDGKLDIVVASSGSGRISVIRNMSTPGTIDMAPNLNLALSTGSYETALADFDGDGKLDIAAAGFDNNTVMIFRNIVTEVPTAAFTSSGTFTAYHVDFPVGNGPVSIAAADLNADGLADIVVSNTNSNDITVLRNNSDVDTFMFSTAATLAAGSAPQEIVIADLNNDGKPDLVYPTFGDQKLNIIPDNSTGGTLNSGSFGPKVSYSIGTGANGLSIGDINGDGKMDIVLSKLFFDSFTVMRNTLTGSAINATSFTYDSTYHVGTGFGPLGITIADVDGDTKADVITANNFNSTVSIFQSYEIPQAGGITGSDSLCVNSTGTYTSSHDPSATGYWTISNGHATVSWTPGAGDTMATVTGISAGVDTLMFTVVYLSDTNTVTKVIRIDGLADTGNITGPSQVCSGATISLANVASGGMWSSSDTSIASVDSMTGVVLGRNPGNATIMYTATSVSCGSLTASHPVTVLMSPDAGTVTGPTGTCVGSTITLTASNPGGSWFNMHPAVATDVPSSTTDVVTGQSLGADTILYIMPSPSCGTDTVFHSIGVIDGANSLPIIGDTFVCRGASTTLANAATGGVWTTDAPLVVFVNPVTGEVTGLTAGTAHISYTVAYACGSADTFMTFTVRPNPVITPIANQTVCNGSLLTIPLTSSIPGSTFTWTNSDTTIGLDSMGTGTPISFTASDTAVGGTTATISVTAMANGCTSTPEDFTITVKPTARLASSVIMPSVCDNMPFTYTSVADRPGTTFSWHRGATPGITNGPASGTGPVISETLHNSTADSLFVIYMDTLNYNGCITTTPIQLYVKATPMLSTTMNLPICDSSNFIFTPTSPTGGASYAWTRDTVTGIANPAASGVNGVNEYLDNTGSSPVMVTYVYTITASGCADTENVTVMVAPTMTLSSATFAGTYCDSSLFTYYPASATPGVSFSWTRDTVSGIMNPAGTGTDTVMEYLYNTTDTAIDVTYRYTISTLGCTDTQLVHVTVNPRGMLTSDLTPPAICSGSTFSYTPTSNLSGASFSWTRPSVAGINNLPASGVGNPNEVLYNYFASAVDVPYMFTTTALGCSYSQTVTVRVQPQPVLSVLSDRVCSGSPYMFTITSPVAGTSFSWVRYSHAGIAPDSSSGTGNVIMDTLTNSTLSTIQVWYVFTLTANGCSYLDTFTLNVDPRVTPAPAITTSTPDTVCQNTMYQNFSASIVPADTNIQYTWSVTNGTLWAVGANSQNALVNFTTPGTAMVMLTSNIASISCPTIDTFRVTVRNSVSPEPSVIYFNKQFVCLPADLDSYQWGYDDANFSPTVLTGETNQDYINAAPDWSKYYWVMTTKADCRQKTYYRVPTAIVDVNTDEISMNLYPNPASDQLTIEVNSTAVGNMDIQVLNMVGQSVGTTQLVNGKAVFNVSELAQGAYLVACYRNGVKVAASRFVKN